MSAIIPGMAPTTQQTLGGFLKEARNGRPMLDVAIAYRERWKERITPETVRAYESDEVKRPNILIVARLCALYGARLDDWSEELAGQARLASDVLRAVAGGDPDGPSDSPGTQGPSISVMSSRRFLPRAS